ncbi:MAG: hypothetical protein LBL46_03605 [Rickettsiales bacterium]|jgi:hypothetical protein|nr:hypothetical protein [Rickettsiales bacterium]
MKKTLSLILALGVLAACGEGDSSKGAGGKGPKPGDSVVYKCPGDQTTISLTLVKDNYYVLFQGMIKTCLTREDKDGYQNYNPQPNYFNFGFQITPEGQPYSMKFGTKNGPCEVVEKKDGYADQSCIPAAAK